MQKQDQLKFVVEDLMQAFKKILFLFLLWVGVAQSVYAQETPFLSKKQIAQLQDISVVYLVDIGIMSRVPLALPPRDPHFHRRLQEQDRQQLISLLAQSKTLTTLPGPEVCQYQPGYQLDFLDTEGQVMTSVLICFNCDVWATQNAQSNTMVYGTAVVERQQLLKLIQRYFDNAPKK